ncbi:bacillithiol biosynthesis BshC, partial [Candidatus Latescibacterota bacterium]
VTAMIGGPGERRYLEQIQPLYGLFSVDRSTVWPRASFTMVDRRIERIADKEGLPIERLFDEPDRLRSELAADRLPEPLATVLESLASGIDSGFADLAASVEGIDKSLVSSVEKDKGRALHVINGIRERITRAHRASSATTEQRLGSASYTLRPDGGPQERWFGADMVLLMLGTEGLGDVIEATSPGEEIHRLVFIEG